MDYRRGVHLRDPGLDNPERQSDFAHGHLLVVVERHHQPLPVRQICDCIGQATFELSPQARNSGSSSGRPGI
jgi:hypothetical protein